MVRNSLCAYLPCIRACALTLTPLTSSEVELGLGIHGEAGVRKQPLESADATVDQLLTAILADAKVVA